MKGLKACAQIGVLSEEFVEKAMVFERSGSRILRTHWFLRVVGWAGEARRLQMNKTLVFLKVPGWPGGSWPAKMFKN